MDGKADGEPEKEDVISKDTEPKYGTFRRNFRNGQEFGPTSIAYKLVDQEGRLISAKDNEGLGLYAVSEDREKQIEFEKVGDFLSS